MRHKDDAKITALFHATIAVVNDVGFAASSIQKIAKRAGVSPATLYVYHENKEALLVSTYLAIKDELAACLMAGFDRQRPLQDSLRDFWQALFRFVSEQPDKYQFIDQFTNSPFVHLADMSALEIPYQPLYRGLQAGIETKLIKDLPRATLLAFILAPAVFLAKSRLGIGFEASPANIEAAFQLAWDAITD